VSVRISYDIKCNAFLIMKPRSYTTEQSVQ